MSNKEFEKPNRHPNLQFVFPNLWQYWISENLRVAAVFSPIDDENAILNLRFCQNFITDHGLAWLVNKFGALGYFYIERQDRWVVESQRPKRSGLWKGEKPIPADQLIILYRKRREALRYIHSNLLVFRSYERFLH